MLRNSRTFPGQECDCSASIASAVKGTGFHPFCAHTCAAKCCDQRRNIVAPLAQRRQHQGKNIDAMKQILPEFLLAHARFQIAMRRHHDANVHRDRLIAADALDFAFFEHAQQFRLHVQRHVADLVEKNRSLIRLLKFADVPSRTLR